MSQAQAAPLIPEWSLAVLLTLTWLGLWVFIIYRVTRIGIEPKPRPRLPGWEPGPPPEYRYEERTEYRVPGPSRQKPLPRYRGKAMFPSKAVRQAIRRSVKRGK